MSSGASHIRNAAVFNAIILFLIKKIIIDLSFLTSKNFHIFLFFIFVSINYLTFKNSFNIDDVNLRSVDSLKGNFLFLVYSYLS